MKIGLFSFTHPFRLVAMRSSARSKTFESRVRPDFRALLLAAAVAVFPQVVEAQRAPLDPSRTLGTESCRDCHEPILEKHNRSTHAKSFMSLLLRDKTRDMAERIGMEVSEIATSAKCVRCHFTRETFSGAVETTESISCESCHGEAESWIDIHTRKSLDTKSRVHQSIKAGMRHPADFIALADNCFQCHIVDDEKLVDSGGHPPFTEGFELLAAYLGEVDHHYLVQEAGKSVKTQSSVLQPVPVERRRMLFLCGKLLHLSHSLCAVGCSREAPVDRHGKLVGRADGSRSFLVQHALSIRNQLREMREISALVDLPEYSRAINLVESLPMSTGHGEDFEAASAEVRQIAQGLADRSDGREFGNLDPLLDRVTSSASTTSR